MKYRYSAGKITFDIINHTFLLLFAIACIFPILHVLAMSFSSPNAVASGFVSIWPVGFNLESYKFILEKSEFFTAFFVTVKRVLLAVPVNMILLILTAYPLSKTKKDFKHRTLIAWIFMITMLFSGGLIPTFLLIKNIGLMNNIWALILPGAVPAYYLVILLNFFRNVPPEFQDAAFIDGAGHFRILKNIYIPLSIPAIVTIALFIIVNHWNSWFDGMIYMNDTSKYPLQTYLQTVIIQVDIESLARMNLNLLQNVSNRTQKCAQIFIAMIPIIIVYPFAQRYFITGMNLGGIKG